MGGATLGSYIDPDNKNVASKRRRRRPALVLEPLPPSGEAASGSSSRSTTPRVGTVGKEATKASDSPHLHERPPGPQGVCNRHQPHDPQYRNRGIHPLSAAGFPHRGLRIRGFRAPRLFAPTSSRTTSSPRSDSASGSETNGSFSIPSRSASASHSGNTDLSTANISGSRTPPVWEAVPLRARPVPEIVDFE